MIQGLRAQASDPALHPKGDTRQTSNHIRYYRQAHTFRLRYIRSSNDDAASPSFFGGAIVVSSHKIHVAGSLGIEGIPEETGRNWIKGHTNKQTLLEEFWFGANQNSLGPGIDTRLRHHKASCPAQTPDRFPHHHTPAANWGTVHGALLFSLCHQANKIRRQS